MQKVRGAGAINTPEYIYIFASNIIGIFTEALRNELTCRADRARRAGGSNASPDFGL